MNRLLVVDDNQQNIYMAEVLFSNNGFEVTSAANGAEALKKAREKAPDLIIADILMPVMDGFALCREWKMDEKLKFIPFIFYTATYTDPEDEKFALSLGAERFIVKPVDTDYLIHTVHEVLNEAKRNRPGSSTKVLPGEEIYLKQYNQTLIHKLEGKLAQLESANKALENMIEERKQVEEKLRILQKQLVQAQKMEAIGTLAGGIAHDFNNILLGIMGNAEIALINTREDKPCENNIKKAISACHRAKELVNQILTFSRQTEMDHMPVNVKHIAREVLHLLRASLPSTIEIKHRLESEAFVMANPIGIYQVMMNICTNSGHAMKKTGGTLDIILTDIEFDGPCYGLAAGSYLKMEITDTGVGMAPKQLDRIFEPYFTTKKEGEGTGLGLSVVQGIVKDIGGAVSVESEPNKGTTFNIFLPVIEAEAVSDAPMKTSLEGGKERILFVDDELILIEIGTKFLEKLGYQVTAFKDSKKALKIFKEKPNAFDMVITDLTMPGLTGIMLAREMLAIRPDLPVILCTGYIDGETEQIAEQSGVKAFLKKPFVFKDLSFTIRGVFDH